MLAAVAADAGPSWTRFEAVIGGAIERITEQFPATPIRAFGEAVNLLCERGDPDGAVALRGVLEPTDGGAAFRCSAATRWIRSIGRRRSRSARSCRAHSHMLPPPTRAASSAQSTPPWRGHSGGDSGKVYALVGDQARATNVPEGQLALMWVSANMPTSSERYLDAARAHYALPATSAVAEPA